MFHLCTSDIFHWIVNNIIWSRKGNKNIGESFTFKKFHFLTSTFLPLSIRSMQKLSALSNLAACKKRGVIAMFWKEFDASAFLCKIYFHPKTIALVAELTSVTFWLGWFTSALWSWPFTSLGFSCSASLSWSVETA